MLQIEYLKNPGADAYTKYILTTLKLTLSYLLTLLLGYLLTWETKLSCNAPFLSSYLKMLISIFIFQCDRLKYIGFRLTELKLAHDTDRLCELLAL